MTSMLSREPTRPTLPAFVGVVIPAHNEQEHIGRAVHAVRRSLGVRLLGGVASWIVVVDDSSTDATRSRARLALGWHGEVLTGRFGTAGAARRAGFERLLALASERASLDDVWFATTDADSRVPRTWITDGVRWWRRGFEAVAGMVEPDWQSDADASLRARYDQMMAAQGTENGHPHVYGANLGFTAAAYIRAGRMPTIATGEDHQMWLALRAAGARVVSVADNPVATSTRRAGRAPAGFAALLASLGD
jgi:hypothetical protein